MACNVETGEPVYLDKSCITWDHYDVCKASCALPVACHPYEVGGICLDGGMADPVPIQKAFDDGAATRWVLILTKPRHRPSGPRTTPSLLLLRLRYPKAAAQLALRYKKYNDGVALAKEYEKQGKLLIVAPDSIGNLTTLGRTKEDLDMLYEKGLKDGQQIKAFFREDVTHGNSKIRRALPRFF